MDLLQGLEARNLQHVILQVFSHLSHSDVTRCRLASPEWDGLLRAAVVEGGWGEAERCRYGWMEGRIRMRRARQEALGIEKRTSLSTTTRYLVGKRGDCLLEYSFAGGDQASNVVYDDDVLRGEDGSNRGDKIRIRHYDRILDLSASVFVAHGDRNCSKEKEEEDVLEGVRLRFESLPKELRALRLLEMVVWGRIVVIGGVANLHCIWVFDLESGAELACHCLEEEVAENGEEEEDDRWHHSLQPAFSSPSGEVAELYSCLVTAAGIAVRRVDRETGRLRPVKVITKKGGRRRGGFVKCQVLGASLGHLLVQHHEAVGRIGDGTGRDSCASSEDEEDHRSVIKVYSLKEEEEEEEGGPVAEYETNSGRGGNSPAVIVGERVFSLEGGDLSRGCDITSIDLAADKRPRMVSSLRSKEKGEGSPIGLWRRRYKNKGPPFGLRLLASNDLLAVEQCLHIRDRTDCSLMYSGASASSLRWLFRRRKAEGDFVPIPAFAHRSLLAGGVLISTCNRSVGEEEERPCQLVARTLRGESCDDGVNNRNLSECLRRQGLLPEEGQAVLELWPAFNGREYGRSVFVQMAKIAGPGEPDEGRARPVKLGYSRQIYELYFDLDIDYKGE